MAAGVGNGVLVDVGSEVQAAASAQQATTAPTLTKPRLLSATRSPQSERLDNRRPRALALCAFQSVGHTLLTLAKGGSAHNRGAPDRTDGNLSLYPPWALAQSSCPSIRLRRRLLGSICQSGVVRGVGRPARSVVRNANVLSVPLAVHIGLARQLVDQGLWGVRGVLW